MKSSRHVPFVFLLALGVAASPASCEDRVVVKDSFESAGNWTMQSAQGAISIEQDRRDFPHAPYAIVQGGVFFVDLPAPVTSDFTLSFDALHSRFSRTLFAGLTDSSGENGYGVRWSSGKDANQHGGNGAVSIVSFAGKALSAANPATAYYGESLTPAVNSGHAATTAESLTFAHVELSWTASTRTLVLRVDGSPKTSVVDSAHASFTRLIIGGGRGSRFDNVALRVASDAGPSR